MQLNSVEELISEIRQGRMVVIVDDDAEKGVNEGVVMMAAEHVEPEHVNFMARKARGLVCLALTEERCRLLGLPPMADEPSGEKSNFTVSIEAREGISTGISAADRARTIQVAVAPQTVADDIVQPGHVFPLTVMPGGVLTRAGHTEAASDYARLAGLQPAAMLADILTPAGELANGVELAEFAARHKLKIGSIADLIHFRVVSERTIRKVREGRVDTAYGAFNLAAYRDQTTGHVHLALYRGRIDATEPTLVRVHASSAVRDLLSVEAPEWPSWSVGRCLRAVSEADSGVVVLLARQESEDALLHSIDIALGQARPEAAPGGGSTYLTVGIGSQILRDLGVGKIRLMGAPIKYNAISGFDLEVIEYVAPAKESNHG
jgi:3,4-dihydroxy 2-butanone 4-phosphate synthase/GTP cyclohydrolase II